MDPKFIGKDNLEAIANQLHREVIMGPVSYRPEVFNQMQIRVLQGVQFRDTKYVLTRKGHTTRRKVVGDDINSKIGLISERKLNAQLAWNKYIDNKDNYVEVPIVDAKNTGKFTYPLSEIAIKAILELYGGDLFDCLVHGDVSIEDVAGNEDTVFLSLYDGFNTKLNQDIEDGYISEILGNLVSLDAISAPDNPTDSSAYSTFKSFVMKWTPALRNAREVLVYCTPTTADNIATGYKHSNANISGVTYMDDGSFKVPAFPNVKIIPQAVLGDGDRLFATIPYNFEYGIDTMDARTNVMVKEGTDKDLMDVVFQIQSIQGTRVVNINASSFCMSNGNLVPVGLSGDYRRETFIVTSNDPDRGTVTVNGGAPVNTTDYPAGTTLALKATAKAGSRFVRWIIGSKSITDAETTVTTKGLPGSAIAEFQAE